MGTNGKFATVSRFGPGTPFVEAFGLLTTSLLLRNGTDGGRDINTICVTSAQPGAGTSTTALNLALTMATAGRRTLLVDGNVRAPVLHVPFNVPQSPGLAEILTKKAQVKEAIRASKTSNLYLLPAGAAEGSPAALMQPQLLGAILDQIRGSYEFAIMDTPPALRYPDALHIARATDGVILVVPAEGAGRQGQVEVRRRFERVNVKILGVVMNRMNPREAVRG